MKTQSLTRISIPLSLFLVTTSPVPVRIQSSESSESRSRGRRANIDLGSVQVMVCETCARLGFSRCESRYHRVGLIRQPQIPCPH